MKLIESTFGPGFPSIKELFQNISVVFLHTNPFMEFPAPTSNKMVYIGGLVNDDAAKDIQKINPVKFGGIRIFDWKMDFLYFRIFAAFWTMPTGVVPSSYPSVQLQTLGQLGQTCSGPCSGHLPISPRFNSFGNITTKRRGKDRLLDSLQTCTPSYGSTKGPF
jgi:hypothetical protein